MHGPSETRVAFDDATTALLLAFADTLIPPGNGFPAPSECRIVEDFMTRYVASGDVATQPPGVSEADVARLCTRLGEGFAVAGATARTEMLTALQSQDAGLFARLLALVYAGYYSRPAVRAAIAQTLPAGRDLRGSPQPYGYADVIEPWDMDLIRHTGTYLTTDQVRPVDPVKLAALAAQLDAERPKEATR